MNRSRRLPTSSRTFRPASGRTRDHRSLEFASGTRVRPARAAKAMRPDSRSRSTAWRRRRADGVALTISSGFRGEAEQARLFVAHADQKWVAPRFGCVKRYSWEPRHYGLPWPCNALPRSDRVTAAVTASVTTSGAGLEGPVAARLRMAGTTP